MDATLIEAWAGRKSFRLKDDRDQEGRNFRQQRRSNRNHQSRRDPEARLYRKGKGRTHGWLT